MPDQGRSSDPASPPRRGGKPSASERSQRLDAFLTRLQRMSEEERVRAARFGGFDHWQRSVWAAHYPEQVPLVNGEYEWIALGLADLD